MKNKVKKFLSYLQETVDLNPIVSKKEKLLPFDDKDLKVLKNRNIKQEPLMAKDYKALKNRISKEKRELIKTRNKIYKNVKEYENVKKEEMNFLFKPMTVIKSDNEWHDEVGKVSSLNKEIENKKDTYSKSLSLILKRFFSIGGKMPKRYLYLPLTASNKLDIASIEKLNKESKYNVFRNIGKGSFLKADDSQMEVIDYLNHYGYKCDEKSYLQNKCQNENGKTIPIDMELNRIEDIDINKKKQFIDKLKSKATLTEIENKTIQSAERDIEKKENFKDYYLYKTIDDKENINLFMDHMIILTWVPRMIMSQSTNTQWVSCMRYFIGDMIDKKELDGDNPEEVGTNVHHVLSGMENGVFIAWLVNMKDLKAKKPVARILMKPYTNGEGDTYYWPSTVYTTGGQKSVINVFSNTLKKYALQKQRGLVDFTLKNPEAFRLADDVYHDSDDMYSLNMLSTQKQKISDTLQDSTFNKSEIYTIINSQDSKAENIVDFFNNDKFKNAIFDGDKDYNKVVINTIYVLVKTKKYKLINDFFNIFEKNKNIEIFLAAFRHFLTDVYHEVASIPSIIDKNMLKFLFKKFMPHMVKYKEFNLLSYKSIKLKSAYTNPSDLRNKTFIDDLLDIVPTYLDDMDVKSFEMVFLYALKIKTLKKVIIKNPGLQQGVVILYDDLIDKVFDEDKERFYFILDNFKLSSQFIKDYTYTFMNYKTLKSNAKNMSYEEIVAFLSNDKIMLNDNELDSKNQYIIQNFSYSYAFYIDLLTRLTEKQMDNIVVLLKKKNFDILKLVEDEENLVDIRGMDIGKLYEATKTKNKYAEKLFSDFCKAMQKQDQKSYISYDYIKDYVKSDIALDKPINYIFIKQTSDLYLNYIENHMDEITDLPGFIKGFQDILFKSKKITDSDINKMIEIAKPYTKEDIFWKCVKDYSLENRYEIILAILNPEMYKKHLDQLPIDPIISPAVYFEMPYSDTLKIINLLAKNKIMFHVEDADLSDYLSEDRDGVILRIMMYLEQKNILSKESIPNTTSYLKVLVFNMLQNRLKQDENLKAEILKFYSKRLKDEKDADPYKIYYKIIDSIERLINKNDEKAIEDFIATFLTENQKRILLEQSTEHLTNREKYLSVSSYKFFFSLFDKLKIDINSDKFEDNFETLIMELNSLDSIYKIIESGFKTDFILKILKNQTADFYYDRIQNTGFSTNRRQPSKSKNEMLKQIFKYLSDDSLKNIISDCEEEDSDYRTILKVATENLK